MLRCRDFSTPQSSAEYFSPHPGPLAPSVAMVGARGKNKNTALSF